MYVSWVAGFTGIDQAYEAPVKSEIDLEAGRQSIDECVEKVVSLLQEKVSTLQPLYTV